MEITMMARRKPVTEIGNDNGKEHWHFNLGIPVVFILTTIFSTGSVVGTFIWYASQFNARVNTVEKLQSDTVLVLEKVQATATAQGNQLVRLDEKSISTQATLARIEALLTPVGKGR